MKYKGLKYNKSGEVSFPEQTLKILEEGGFIMANGGAPMSADDRASNLFENSKEDIARKEGVQGEGWRFAARGAQFLGGAALTAFVPGAQGVGVGLMGRFYTRYS